MLYRHKSGLSLHKAEQHDLSCLLQYKRESWAATHHCVILNWDDQIRWHESLAGDATRLVLVATADYSIGPFILNNIDMINGSAEMSYGVYESQRGQGYGRKLVAAGVDLCFEILNLRRLGCEVLSHNGASVKCVEHAGFVREGLKRAAVSRFGREYDSVVYGLLRSDWLGLREQDGQHV